jgi:hypothetical protein
LNTNQPKNLGDWKIMNRKLIALAVAGVMAAPLVAQADVSLGGDARVRYYSQTPDGGDAGAVSDSRVRLTINATDGNVAGVNYRMKLSNTTHNTADGSDKPILATDYAYAYVNTGLVKVSGGVMQITWGTGLVVNDARPNRIILSKGMGGFTVALGFDKIRESGLGVNDDGDKDNMLIFGKTKDFGLLYVSTQDHAASTDVTFVDGFYKGKFGNVGLNAEVGSWGGDGTGTILGATVMVPVGPATIVGVLINADDTGHFDGDYLADLNVTAFDQDHVGLGNMAASADESLTLVGLAGVFAIGDKTTAQLTVANVSMSDAGADSISVVDGSIAYKVGEKSKVVGYFTTVSDTADGYGANIETKF